MTIRVLNEVFPTMIKAIIFDFGRVIFDFDNNLFIENISRFTDKTVPELNDLIYHSSDLPRRFETGLISSEAFFNEITRECNLSMSKADFIKAYTGIFTPIQSTIHLIRRLKRVYKIGLLSNTSEWDFENIIEPSEVFDLFDAISLSFKVGAMKPDKEIFVDCLNKLERQPEECVYIDDIREYVQAAAKIGIKGIQYLYHELLVFSLKKLDVQL